MLKVANLDNRDLSVVELLFRRLRARIGHSRSEKDWPPTCDKYHEIGQIHTIMGCLGLLGLIVREPISVAHFWVSLTMSFPKSAGGAPISQD